MVIGCGVVGVFLVVVDVVIVVFGWCSGFGCFVVGIVDVGCLVGYIVVVLCS